MSVSLLFVLAFVTLACSEADESVPPLALESAPAASPMAAPARHVGSDVCGGCHSKAFAQWRGSDHDRAMEHASADSIRGRFDGREFRSGQQRWRFTTEDGRYMVELAEPNARPRRWPVEFTFGFEPLQQYLVSFPGGRLQALPIAWDARPAAQGGGRFFALQSEESLSVGGPLHWEGLAYNWNSQCATCHSTRLEKRYDAERDVFDTRYAEIDVGCEACHGPGSAHVDAMALDGGTDAGGVGSDGNGALGLVVRFDAWDPERWQRVGDAPIATPVRPRADDSEIDVCAPCHARRSALSDPVEIGADFLDGHRPTFLDPGLYTDDGQILDEVYVWGSFLQSRMYAAGVRCSDCHEPHSLALRRPGNALCGGCHSSAVYASKQHHGHDPAAAGGACVDCHMPQRVYMEIDARRDHAFASPAPRVSKALDSALACLRCHPGKDADWAGKATLAWHGNAASELRRPVTRWAERLIDAHGARRDADRWLEVARDPGATAFVRASAWTRFAREASAAPDFDSLEALRDAPSDLERLALVEVARRLPPEIQRALLVPLLSDARRAVRLAAGEVLSGLSSSQFKTADRSRLARVMREYREAQRANLERPEAWVNLGILDAMLGDGDAAEAAYRQAVARSPAFVPAYLHWAELERVRGNDPESVRLLREALARLPDDAEVRHALGLALHRAGQADEALHELARAAQQAPGSPHLSLAWALALDASGERERAISVLEAAVARQDDSADLFHALTTLLRDQGELERARAGVAEWLRKFPGDARAAALGEALDSASRSRR